MSFLSPYTIGGPRWFEPGAPLNDPDVATYYAGEAKGYTDYPALPG
ncbi:MAG: hypothetical protein A4E35_00222 [Methanoregula sp. PtaU1.Bin051]|nr:MAG: hypothetical protein A4E35_00222 [Methanoregula sp. PtaU1.Bin051]